MSHILWAALTGRGLLASLPQAGRQGAVQHRDPPTQKFFPAFCVLLVTDVRKALFPRGEKMCEQDRQQGEKSVSRAEK